MKFKLLMSLFFIITVSCGPFPHQVMQDVTKDIPYNEVAKAPEAFTSGELSWARIPFALAMVLIAATPFEQTARRLQLVWGVIPVPVAPFDDTDSMIQTMVQAAVQLGYANVGDEVVLTAGIPFEVHGVTNMLKVHTVREEDLGQPGGAAEV